MSTYDSADRILAYLEIRQGQTNADPEILHEVTTIRDGAEVTGVLLASDIGLILWQRREAIEQLTSLANAIRPVAALVAVAADGFLAGIGSDA